MTEQVEPWTPADIAIATELYAATGGTGPVAGDDPLVQLFARFRRQSTEPLVARIEVLEAGLQMMLTWSDNIMRAHGVTREQKAVKKARALLEQKP